MAHEQDLDEARLRWVLADGDLVHVSTFAHLPPPRRPDVCCPVGERPVILKLGQIRIHHYAHRPEEDCAASAPESALHLNTKFHLYHELRSAKRLVISDPCWETDTSEPSPGAHLCGARKVEWLSGFDEVVVERALDSIRPDILLLSGGEAVGAIEIVYTHQVDAAKEQKLRDLGVPWLEVEASPELFAGEAPWRSGSPLPYLRRQPWPVWRCRRHAAEWQKILAEREAERERRKREKETETLFVRIVDFYHASGGHFRDLYRIRVWAPNAQPRESLVDAWGDPKVSFSMASPPDRDTIRTLNLRFRSWLATRHGQSICDSPMRWTKPQDLPEANVLDCAWYPPRYRFSRRYRRWFPLRELSDFRWVEAGPLRAGIWDGIQLYPSWWPKQRLLVDERGDCFPKRPGMRLRS